MVSGELAVQIGQKSDEFAKCSNGESDAIIRGYKGSEMMRMEDGRRMVGWMLHYFLDEYYDGNRTGMAEAMGLSRHTLWRAFNVIDSRKGKISPLVLQQLIWCCVQNDHSLDRAIRRYAEQMRTTGMEQCQQAINWWDEVESHESEVLVLAQAFIAEMREILGCKAVHGIGVPHCKHIMNCPIIRMTTLTQESANRGCAFTEDDKSQES